MSRKIPLVHHDPEDPRHVLLAHFRDGVIDALLKAIHMPAFKDLDDIEQKEVAAEGSIIGALCAVGLMMDHYVPKRVVDLLLKRLPGMADSANSMLVGADFSGKGLH